MKTMYGLYEFRNGYHFTGVVADSEEKIIDYLNHKYTVTDEYGTRPRWNRNAFAIIELKLTILE